MIEKSHIGLVSDHSFTTKSFKIQWYLRELGLPRTDLVTSLFNLENLSFGELEFFFMVTFKEIFDILLLNTIET